MNPNFTFQRAASVAIAALLAGAMAAPASAATAQNGLGLNGLGLNGLGLNGLGLNGASTAGAKLMIDTCGPKPPALCKPQAGFHIQSVTLPQGNAPVIIRRPGAGSDGTNGASRSGVSLDALRPDTGGVMNGTLRSGLMRPGAGSDGTNGVSRTGFIGR